MKLHRAASIAAIVAAIVAVAQYIDSNVGKQLFKNIPTMEKEIKEKANITLSLDLPEYSAEKNWLLAMYEASILHSDSHRKSIALVSVVEASLSVSDLNMAVIAASQIPDFTRKRNSLYLIVDEAIKLQSTIGYAVVAADKMPSSHGERVALDRIMRAFDELAKNRTLDSEDLPSR